MSDATLDAQGRPEPPFFADEAETLLGFLEFQRATLLWKASELSDEQLGVSLPPSSMSLGGILKHMALVEDYWFTTVIGGGALPEPWASVPEEVQDWEWQSASADSGEYLRGLLRQRAEASRAVVAAALSSGVAEGMKAAHPAWGGRGQVSLRWVLVHMVEEYARHNGHADLIRQSIDGATGE